VFLQKSSVNDEGIVMSIDSPFDPRSALVKTKYFSLHPKPLERWLWKQSLPPTAERVFWLHWEAGMQNGDWCSEIPIKRVALECCVDTSTVTRAYQLLKALSLIRREDPGRDPSNPFQQATAITEVRLPREFVSELSRSPNRPVKGAVQATPDARESQPVTAAPIEQSTPMISSPVTQKAVPRASSREEAKALWGRASAAESSRFYRASNDRLTNMEFDADTRLTPEDRGQILAQLAQHAAARPTPSPAKVAAPVANTGPRRLSMLELARTRNSILECVPGPGAADILRQVLWAIEEGALKRFESGHAINIAIKKVREGEWQKPHRMPPNWHPRAAAGKSARPEPCSVA
jgi:hypothetical protein